MEDKKFKFLDYCTIVSKDQKKFPKSSVCFAEVIPNYLRTSQLENQSYFLYICKSPDYGWKHNSRHHFLLTLSEFRKLIRNIKSYYNFNYSIREIKHNKEEFYRIKINIPKLHRGYIDLFILTALRYSYEYPFNVILKDAFKLMHDPTFKQLNLINCCNLIWKLIFARNERTVHSLCDEYPLYTNKKDVKKRLTTTDRLNEIFNTKQKRTPTFFENDCESLDFWLSDKKFEERKVVYLNNLKIFKKK